MLSQMVRPNRVAPMSISAVRRSIHSLLALCMLLIASVSTAADRKAPDFTLKDLDGKQQSLSALRGKVVGLYFWATYCPECVTSFPVIQRLSGAFGGRAVILGVNKQLPELSKRFLNRSGFRLRVLHDPYGRVTNSYGISAIPVLILIDQRGMVGRTFYGAVSEKEVRATIDALLRGNTSSTSVPKTHGMCEEIRLDPPPVRSSGRVMVPMRGIFQWLGAKVAWNEKTRTVAASKGLRRLEVKVGSLRAKVGGKPVSLDAPPQMISGTVYVPLRFVGQALGVKVDYRPQDGGILLKSGSRCGFVQL